MNDIEQRLRDSLATRAADVEPTPRLWQEVDRRITRRRRRRLAVWSLAGATAVAVAVLVLPALLGTTVTLPEIEPLVPPETSDDGAAADDERDEGDDPADGPRDGPTDGPTEEPGTDDSTDADSGPDGGDAGAVGDATLLVADNRELRLIGPAGETVIHTLDPRGESLVTGLAVRPGSTPDDLTAAVLTQAEGMFDLRELRVVDGEATLEVFAPAYRPGAGSSAGEGMSVQGPVWSPDGTSLAWVEYGTGGTVLRTIGWSDDGPGTGDRATDNASWILGTTLPPGSVPNDWIASGDDSTVIRLTMPDSNSGWFEIRLDRGADDAWALVGSDAQAAPVEDPAAGRVAAVAGTTAGADAGGALWMVRLTAEGVVLVHDPSGSASVIGLPSTLLPDDGLATVWVRSLGDAALVGSRQRSAAYVVTRSGDLTELPGPVSAADVVR